jgi:nitroreductase
MTIEDIISRNRSCRRFYPSKTVSKKVLRGLINLARLSASAANLQPLKYIISNTPDKNAKILRIGLALERTKGLQHTYLSLETGR